MESASYQSETKLPHEPITLELKDEDIQATMTAYLDFLKLHSIERHRISHFDETKPRTGMSGYANRDIRDHKHVFHMTPELEQKFSGNQHTLPRATRDFLQLASEAYYSLSRSTREKYEELQEEIPMLVGIHFPKSGKLSHHLRFLAYHGSNEGVLAQGHYDKGTGTIAVAESHPGLRLGLGSDDLTLLQRTAFNPIMFQGYGWHQLAEMLDAQPTRRAAWHDVIETGQTFDEETLRWALVFFIDPANMYLESTPIQTHTPIPWRLAELALRSDEGSFLV